MPRLLRRRSALMSGPECRRLAKLARKRSDLAAARELAETALNLDRATGDEAGVSEDAALLAGLYMACGEAGLAEVAAVEALRCNGTTASAICAAGVLGLVYVRQEDYARGEQMFLNALRAALQSGRSDLQATMYANLATLNAAGGNFETA